MGVQRLRPGSCGPREEGDEGSKEEGNPCLPVRLSRGGVFLVLMGKENS